MNYLLGYLLRCSLAILGVFLYGFIMGIILLWGAGFFRKDKK
jgi:hypothetical protein